MEIDPMTKTNPTPPATAADQTEFLGLLPAIATHARIHFRYLRANDRDEALCDAVANAFVAFVRLKVRGKNPNEFPSALARYAALGVRNGRHVGRPSTTRDVLSRQSQRRRGFAVHGFDDLTPNGTAWWRDAVHDSRVNVASQAAFNVDFPSWLETLPVHKRKVATLLARGFRTDSTARLINISPGRVSQIRRELAASWEAFHAGE